MVEAYSTCGRTRVLYACSFYRLIFGFNISFYKSKGYICLTSSIVNMLFQFRF